MDSRRLEEPPMKMKRLLLMLVPALLLTISSRARAQEQNPADTPAETATPDSPATTASPAALPAPPPEPTVHAAPGAPATVEIPCGPEPYTGWGRGTRAPIYVNLMLHVGAFVEDGDNRLTTRDSKVLEGFGGVFRVGAVLSQHHRLGVRMQSFVRPTKKVLLDPPAANDSNSDWGAVSFGYVGPEYLYTNDLGIYVGASLGVAGAMSTSRIDHDDDDDHHVERGSAGVAGIVSLGYEWRTNKWFAMNAELYGGLYHGIDDNENAMNGGVFGLGVGAGF